MINGMYTMATALDARFKVQDVIAHNIANVESAGFRRQVSGFYGFGAALWKAGDESTQVPTAAGVILQDPKWDFTPGAPKKTGQELDFAIHGGEGFFVIQTSAGERYTRDGHFSRDTDGRLVTSKGDPVLSDRGPIVMDKGPITVLGDGTVQQTFNSTTTNLGKLRIELPDKNAALTSDGGGLFSIVGNGSNVAAEKVKITSGELEVSNVNVAQEMVNMIQNSRMAETASKALQMMDDSISKAIQGLGA